VSAVRTHRARCSLHQENATRWTVDFTGALVFGDHIGSMQYSFELESGFAVAAVAGAPLKVTVETQAPVTGTLVVTAHQAA
jgi:hypothetical protein